MKEYKEFDDWANQIVESAIFEAPQKDAIKREIPQTQDIVYQARRKYPDRDTDAALSLFLADKLEDFDRRDLEQNAVINAQRRENSKLNNNLTKLQQELGDIEQSSERTDAELERLKTLSGKLSTDIQQRVVGAREIERALAQVEELRNKPGMSEEKYEELKKKIEDAQQNPNRVNPEEFKKFTDQMAVLRSEQTIEKEQLSRLGQVASNLEAERGELAAARGNLETRISELERREQELPKEIQKEVEKETEQLKRRQKEYRTRVQARSKQAKTLIKNFLDRDLPIIDTRLEKIENELRSLNPEFEQDQVKPIQTTLDPKSKSISKKTDYEKFMSQLFSNQKEHDDFLNNPISLDTYMNMSDEELSKIPAKRFDSLDADINDEELSKRLAASNDQIRNYPKDINKRRTMKQSEKDEQLSEETKIHYGRKMLQLKKQLMDLMAEPEFKRFRVINAAIIAEQNLYPLDKQYLQKNYSDIYHKVLAIMFYQYAQGTDFAEDELLSLAQFPKIVNRRLLKMLDEYVPKQRTLDIEESINKMVDNIIGEQVARWIK